MLQVHQNGGVGVGSFKLVDDFGRGRHTLEEGRGAHSPAYLMIPTVVGEVEKSVFVMDFRDALAKQDPTELQHALTPTRLGTRDWGSEWPLHINCKALTAPRFETAEAAA